MDRQTEQSDKELSGPGDRIRLPAALRLHGMGGQGEEVHPKKSDKERKENKDNFH